MTVCVDFFKYVIVYYYYSPLFFFERKDYPDFF